MRITVPKIEGSQKIRSVRFLHPLAAFTVNVIETSHGVKVHSIKFVKDDLGDDAASDKFIYDIGFSIGQALDGKLVDFSKYDLDFSGLTEFQQKILYTARQIPRGQTVSYSSLAEMAGFKNAVRAAGSVMRNNRFPIIIPCHRVIRKNGEIGGFSGQINGEMVDLKKKLLELERERSV